MKNLLAVIAIALATTAAYAQNVVRLPTVHPAKPVHYQENPPKQKEVWLAVGRSSEGNGSFAIGGRLNRNLGVELGFVADAQIAESEIAGEGIPHSDYTNLGRLRIGNSVGLDLLALSNPARGITLGAGIGAYASESAEIKKSNVTGWNWSENTKTSLRVAVSLMARAEVTRRLSVGAGYHSIRGTNLSVALAF